MRRQSLLARSWRLLCLGMLAGLLVAVAACRPAPSPHAASLDRNALLPIVFPAWPAGASGAEAVLDLSAVADEKTAASRTGVQASVSPLYVVKLDETHAVLLTQASPANETDCHACTVYMGAYFFSRDEEGWRLSARQDAVATSGASGDIGKTSVHRLSEGQYLLAAEWGSCWQGYCGSWLVPVGLRADRATLLSRGAGIALSVDNDGAHGACSALDPGQPPLPDALARECLDIRGQWKVQDGELRVRFSGRLKEEDKDGKRAPLRRVNQEAVYAQRDGKLVLKSGVNPVPGF